MLCDGSFTWVSALLRCLAHAGDALRLTLNQFARLQTAGDGADVIFGARHNPRRVYVPTQAEYPSLTGYRLNDTLTPLLSGSTTLGGVLDISQFYAMTH